MCCFKYYHDNKFDSYQYYHPYQINSKYVAINSKYVAINSKCVAINSKYVAIHSK